MKKLLIILLTLAAGTSFTACENENPENYIVYTDRENIDAGPLSGDFEIKVRSNAPWSVQIQDAAIHSWCTISDVSGDDGEGRFTISVTANDSDRVRVANATVRSGSASQVVTVVQEADGSVSKIRLDKVMQCDYFGDALTEQAGYVEMELRGGMLDTYGNPTGTAYVATIGCFVEMAPDPERAAVTGGTYEPGSKSEGKINTFLLDDDATSFVIYDRHLAKTRFDIAAGSKLQVTSPTENFYYISGDFIDSEGHTVKWYFDGYIKLKNPRGIDSDQNGYKIMRAGNLQSAQYQGDIDGYGSAKLVFDLRDEQTDAGMNLAVYVTRHPDFDEPGVSALTEGTYSFGKTGDPFTIETGFVENSLPYGSYVYQIESGMKYITQMIAEGSFTVKHFRGDEYDITFDLKGEDGTGAPAKEIGKYRYIGLIPFADKKPVTVFLNQPAYATSSATRLDDKTCQCDIRIGTSATQWDKNSQHLQMRLYVNAPDGDQPVTLTEGTYAPSSQTCEPGTYEIGSIPIMSISGTGFYEVDGDGLQQKYLVDRGPILIEKTASGYRITASVSSRNNVTSDRIIVRMSWEGELSFE